MWELDYKEGWALKSWCFRTGVLEKAFVFRILGTARRSSQSILKEINTEYSLEGLMLELKLQHFSHLMHRANLFEKTLMLGKTEGRKRSGVTKDEMLGWHHWLNGYEFEQTPGVNGGHRSLVSCSPWGRKQWDTTDQLIIWTVDQQYMTVAKTRLTSLLALKFHEPWGWYTRTDPREDPFGSVRI